MKTLKVSLLALVFSVGIGGAVVQKIQAAPRVDDPVYSWNNGQFSGTVSQARSHYSCPAGTNLTCATGTAPGQDPVTIKKP
jgi:hypothetical protein